MKKKMEMDEEHIKFCHWLGTAKNSTSQEQEKHLEFCHDSAEPDICPECGSPLVPDSFVDPYGHRIGENAVCNGCGYTEAT
jgi:hypothetical protein